MATSVKRGAGAAKRPKCPSEIVYFTAAVGLLDDPLYLRAFEKVKRLHKGVKVLSAKTLWSSAKDWLATYESVLADVTHVYILPYTGGVAGAGIVEEIGYLDRRSCGSPEVRIFDASLNLRDLHGFLVLDNPTKGRFARLCSGREFASMRQENKPGGKTGWNTKSA